MSAVAVGRQFLSLLCSIALLVSFFITPVFAETARYSKQVAPLARLRSDNSSGSLATRTFPPVALHGGTRLNIVTPVRWNSVAESLVSVLKKTHDQYNTLFGEIPPFAITLKLLDEETFYLSTGAPRWTNAMHYKGQVIIPLPQSGDIDFDNLVRSVKHEFTHAVIHSLSGGRCPGWLDEGIAQWAEGSENPALRPALLNWLDNHKPVPLSMLQGGFTKLDTKMVPAAYAQSLFAVEEVINNHGFGKLRSYLQTLRNGTPKKQAFDESFDETEEQFEARLREAFKGWTEGHSASQNL